MEKYTWHYIVLWQERNDTDNVPTFLNRIGSQGWELCGIVYPYGPHRPNYVFKRASLEK